MGKSTTPKYVIDSPGATPMAWNSKDMGRPTAANLQTHMERLIASCEPGGCNQHLGRCVFFTATLRDNFLGGRVYATWNRVANMNC